MVKKILSPKHLIVLAISFLVSFGAAGADGIQLPDIGDSSGVVVSQSDESAYGGALMREFRRLARVNDDPLVDDYIRHLGYRLVSYSDQPENEFHFFVVNDNNVNAFAAPGGYIGIHSELLLTADTESEVAAVMAHEIAHVTQRHLARAVESAQKMSLPMTLLMLGALIAGGGDADAVQTAVIGSQALMAQHQINFTRSNEYEADRVGIQTLAQAGYDPAGMSDFFGKMARIARTYGNGIKIPEFLRTHPVETTRIAEAKNRAENIRVTGEPVDSERFMYIRERLRVMTSSQPEDAIVYYQALDDLEPHQAYGLAYAQLRANDLVGASDVISTLQGGSQPLPVQLLKADIAMKAAGRDQPYEELVSAYPRNRSVGRSYAQALLMREDDASAKRAEQVLRPLLDLYEDDPTLFLTYSRAADRSGRPVRASEAFAHHTFLQGRVYDAVSQLRSLLKSDGLDYYERSRVEARLARLEPILAHIERENGYDPSEGRSGPGRGLRITAG